MYNPSGVLTHLVINKWKDANFMRHLGIVNKPTTVQSTQPSSSPQSSRGTFFITDLPFTSQAIPSHHTCLYNTSTSICTSIILVIVSTPPLSSFNITPSLQPSSPLRFSQLPLLPHNLFFFSSLASDQYVNEERFNGTENVDLWRGERKGGREEKPGVWEEGRRWRPVGVCDRLKERRKKY